MIRELEEPDKEACETVHREAHGNTVCEIIEAAPGMYNLFMEENHRAGHSMFLHEDGTVDVNYRFVLVIDFTDNTHMNYMCYSLNNL